MEGKTFFAEKSFPRHKMTYQYTGENGKLQKFPRNCANLRNIN